MASISGVDMNALLALETVARQGTVLAAAAEMHVSPGAVSQQIKKAEAQIGVPIFQRSANGLTLTLAGQKMLPALTSASRQIAEAIKSARLSDENILTITAGSAFAASWLVPRLGRFSALHPHYQLRFVATSKLIDFARSDIDLGIRLGTGAWPDVKVEKLVDQQAFPICAPTLAGSLKQPTDLARVPVLFDEGTAFSWKLWFEKAGLDAKFAINGPSFTDPLLAFGAVTAGQGVMLGWSILVADALADGRIVRPFETAIDSGIAYWLVTTPASCRTEKVRLFRAWLIGELIQSFP